MRGVLMTAKAVRQVDRREVSLGRILSLEVGSSLSSPAQWAAVTAAVEDFPLELRALTVRQGIRTLFTGRVDVQTASLDAGGKRLRVEARSKGALLLDNEAEPCVLTGARLATVFNRFAAPYGFFLYNPNPSRSLGLYTVHKGRSEWEALTGFTRRVYGLTPFVRGDTVWVDRPRSAAALAVGDGGIPYLRLEHSLAPYHLLSRVVLRDGEGSYSAAVRNSAAGDIQRKRYVIPANEFVDSPALDANQRIRRSMLEKERVTAVLPGILEIEPGRAVRVADRTFTLHNLLAEEVVWRQSEKGATTTLSLVSGVYY